jgi:hypothetical protein
MFTSLTILEYCFTIYEANGKGETSTGEIKMITKKVPTIQELFFLTGDSLNKIAKKIGRSRYTITDIRYERVVMKVDVLSELMKTYPNLPWVEYVQGLTDNKEEVQIK